MSFISEHFEMLDGIARCMAEQFGENCEVVLHDLTLPYEHTIVSIYHGHVTGRELGGGGTAAGLEILRSNECPEDQYGYLNSTKEGRTLRTSSKYFKDETGRVVGSLCINYDITGFLQGQAAFQAFLGAEFQKQSKEVFTRNVEELLNVLLREAVSSLGKNVSLLSEEDFRQAAADLTKEEKSRVVCYLDGKGAFLIKKSAEQVADFLGISRFTVYNYLNAQREETNGEDFDTKRVDL